MCFQIFCYLTTFFFFGCGVFTYFKNEDYSEVSYKRYDDKSSISYPSTTLCFKVTPNLIQHEILKSVGDGINSSSYVSFLIGRHWDESMMNISYDEATKNLRNYVLEARAIYNSDSEGLPISSKRMSFKDITLPTLYGLFKCITFDLPEDINEKLMYGYVALRNNIFPNKIRPKNDEFEVYFHIRNVFHRAAATGKYNFPKHEHSSILL